jgi:hypothetical protein
MSKAYPSNLTRDQYELYQFLKGQLQIVLAEWSPTLQVKQ